MDTYTYLNQHQQPILDHWAKFLDTYFQDDDTDCGADLVQINKPLFKELLQALSPNKKQPTLDVHALQKYYHRQEPLNPARLYQLVSSLRHSIIADNTPEEAIALLADIDPILDTAMNKLFDQLADPPSAELANRISQMEAITLELAQTTEDAERALVQVHTMYEVSRELSQSLDLAEVMHIAAERLTRVTYAHSGAVWRLHGGTLMAEDLYNLPETILPQLQLSLTDRHHTLLQAIRKQHTIIINSPPQTAADHALLKLLDAKYLMAIPLIINQDLLGLITLHGPDERLLLDQDLIGAIAQQAAIAIQNGQLYTEVQNLNKTLEQRIIARTHELVEEKERLETMYQITSHLTSSLDMDPILNRTLTNLGMAIGAEVGRVFLNEDSYSSDLTCHGSWPLAINETTSSPTGAWAVIAQQVMSSQEALLIDNWEQDMIGLDAAFPAGQSIIAAPIMADRDLHGVLIFGNAQVDHFTTSHLRLLAAVATQLAATINNAKLHEYVRAQVIRLGDLLYKQEVETGQKQAILASIADGVIASDLNGHILLMNPAAETILRGKRERLIGQPMRALFEVFKADGRDKLIETLHRLQNAPANPKEVDELTLELGHQVINVRLMAAFTPANEKIGVVAVLRDISKEVEADRAKTDFIATVSHELRTPMTSIMGYTHLISQGVTGPLTDKQSDFLTIIYRNAERLSQLLNELLDISRIEAGKVSLNLEEQDLTQLAQRVVDELFIPAQDKGLTLALNAAPDLPHIPVDSTRLIQVLTNLVGNAIAYTEEGGVTITIDTLPDALQVSVSDTGIGMQPEQLRHIFERFYRAEHEVVQKHSGTGLGLAIVHEIVTMHGGRIWVDSAPHEGSTFSFILPLTPLPN
ncbi:MAG TPA: ATP-binding protein [Anaerolineae bacterium]|nr:ATP-binding protein [Anaerolineae bacterium]